MTEFYVELQDADGTCYGATNWRGEVAYFDDLEEARLFAKAQLNDEFILTRVISVGNDRSRVIDFFQR